MTQTSLQRLGLYQLIALIVLAISVIALAFTSISTQTALCAFKTDLNRRIETNLSLLESNSGDVIHAYGLSIPRTVLENNVRGQQETQRSFHRLWLC